ncbi:MAG: hypothetical protein M0000_11930 [Actinomycetota bacterium]|nr:hypothetical protein [Actinomycetota bacterium]
MALEIYQDPAELYRARGEEVNPNRPLFTGDVFNDVAIPGIQEAGCGIVITHPCSMREGGKLRDRILVASVVGDDAKIPPAKWKSGYYAKAPLPDLGAVGDRVVLLDSIGTVPGEELESANRLACLSDFGINLLQQRLTFYLTRAAIPTQTFQEATVHTMVEAELLEEWIDELTSAGWEPRSATEEFNAFLGEGRPSLQSQLQDPQRRSSVRTACRRKVKELAVRESP